MVVLLLLASAFATQAQFDIVHVRDSIAAFHGKHMKLCGEVSPARTVLYSDTVYQYHGRVGIKLAGYPTSGRNQCVVGILQRTDGQAPEALATIMMTDAAVHPDYVLVADAT